MMQNVENVNLKLDRYNNLNVNDFVISITHVFLNSNYK